ncbi:MAG: hypothetical protein SCH71_05910 [Desulfobulbaceae bacterium]|nr:hypothetical protein [Desulfobulbaceae bacterium]
MKLKLGFLLMALCCITGCSKKHYYTIQEDSISLYYHNEEAAEVLFASSIDHFAVHPAEANNSLWQISVPLREEFSYFYIVDGRVTLPECSLQQQDDFGSKNCLYVHGM